MESLIDQMVCYVEWGEEENFITNQLRIKLIFQKEVPECNVKYDESMMCD